MAGTACGGDWLAPHPRRCQFIFQLVSKRLGYPPSPAGMVPRPEHDRDLAIHDGNGTDRSNRHAAVS